MSDRPTEAPSESLDISSSSAGGRLRSPSYLGLVATQFLGAFNDNAVRWLLTPVAQRSMDETQAIVLGGILFTLPYLLLMPLAGALADGFSKRRVIVACKVVEIVLAAACLLSIYAGVLPAMFLVVMLFGAQSALFAPAKFGALPEMLRPDRLSAGNGVLGLVTVVGSALGMIVGYRLFGGLAPALSSELYPGALAPAALVIVGAAVIGTLTSLLVRTPAAANPGRRLDWNPLTETIPALRLLAADRALLRAALGVGFFWMLASLAQLNIDPFGTEGLHLPKQDVGLLMAVLVAGLAIGSVTAGVWSRGLVELGIVPLGALGIVISALGVYLCSRGVDLARPLFGQAAFFGCGGTLFLLGASAALFNIPLEAYLQHRSPSASRGTILAGSNFLSFALILVSCGLFELLRGVLHLTPAQVFMTAGLGTIPVVIYVFRLLPNVTARFLFWAASSTLYRLRVVGRENIPERGGALLVANHVSWVDGILVLVSSSRFVRFLVYADYANAPMLRWLARIMGVIPIKASDGPRAIVKALTTAREAIAQGEVVCIFAEGQLSRTGQLQPFQRGLMRIVDGADAPIIPTYLHGLWGSIFSFRGGKFFWKMPRRWPYPVNVHFGKPLTRPDDVNQVRSAVEQLGVEANTLARRHEQLPIQRFLRQCKKSRRRLKIADSSGAELTGGRTLTAVVVLARVVRRLLGRDEPRVGLFLPPSVGGALANMVVALLGRVSVNLNYTLSDDTLQYCIRAAGLKHILTSRKFVEKRPLPSSDAQVVFLEDLKTQAGALDKALGVAACFTPARLLDRLYGLTKLGPDDPLTIIFTSGSTGEPKGVVLSQHNVGSNVQAVENLLQLKLTDSVMGILPFFHSFGYTATLWLPMCFDPIAAYHFNPLDAKIVGKLAEKYKTTLLLSTPTFLRTYLRRIEPAQFKHLDIVVVGAEKMPLDLAAEFEQKFHVQPTEGYGTTELSPVAAVNIPDHRSIDVHQKGTKLGTVGRAIPGCSARVVNPDTFADLGLNQEGLLLIKGPNVMQGYLDQPEKTAAVVRDGWYVTGDYAKIDDEGFITITGRQSRFSKIGGEMVPHIRIEEELTRLVDGAAAEDSGPLLAVTAVPDATRGERLIVLHRPLPRPPSELIKQLSDCGLPNLWLPSAESFYPVEQIPILGSGKLDLRAVKAVAEERTRSAGR